MRAPGPGIFADFSIKLKLDRAKQRERAIRQGQMADPNQPTSLNKAITPVGTCTSMCPEFERVERIVQKMVDKSEKVSPHFAKSLRASAADLRIPVSSPRDKCVPKHGIEDVETVPEIGCWLR